MPELSQWNTVGHSGILFQKLGLVMDRVRLPHKVQGMELRLSEHEGPGANPRFIQS